MSRSKTATDHLFRAWYGHLVLLCTTAALVVVGASTTYNWMLYVSWILFFGWDVCYFVSREAAEDRDSDAVLQSVLTVRTNLSWFILLYGVSIAFFTMGRNDAGYVAEQFVHLCRGAGLPLWLPISPLITASFAVLFIPVHKGSSKGEATSALRMMFVTDVFLQKIVITAFAFSVLRLAVHAAGGV